jgi:large subunit ribosomal protein L30
MSARTNTRTSMGDEYVRVTQVRSTIATKPKHRGTLRALGLRGIGRSRVLPDRPEVRAMFVRVAHLVDVSPATAEEAEEQRGRLDAGRRARRVAEGRAEHSTDGRNRS